MVRTTNHVRGLKFIFGRARHTRHVRYIAVASLQSVGALCQNTLSRRPLPSPLRIPFASLNNAPDTTSQHSEITDQ